MKLAKSLKALSAVCFLLLWIPFAMIMITGPLSIVIWGPESVGAPSNGLFWTMTPWVIMTLALGLGCAFFLIASLLIGGMLNLWMLGTGQDAEAIILATKDTGSRVNDNPVVDFSLEVRPPDLLPFAANARKTVSLIDLPSFQPGKIVRVKYIPGKEHVAIVDANDQELLKAYEARKGLK